MLVLARLMETAMAREPSLHIGTDTAVLDELENTDDLPLELISVGRAHSTNALSPLRTPSCKIF